MDNPFVRCFLVWCSWHGLTTLPTPSAVGAGLGFGAVRTTIALQDLFINDSFLGAGDCPHPRGPVHGGTSAVRAAVLRFCPGGRTQRSMPRRASHLASNSALNSLPPSIWVAFTSNGISLTTLPKNSRPFFAVTLRKAWEQARFATALNSLTAGRPCFGVTAGVLIWMMSPGAVGLRPERRRLGPRPPAAHGSDGFPPLVGNPLDPAPVHEVAEDPSDHAFRGSFASAPQEQWRSWSFHT